MTWLQSPIISYMYIWGWRDCIEILFMIIALYSITLWLNKDRTRKLVYYFYTYCTLILICHYVELPLMSSWLITAAPVAAVVCILMHQEILQKSLALPTKILPAQLDTQWLDELLQSCLIVMNSKKQVLCILEDKDTLNSLLTTLYPMTTQCRKSIIMLMTGSSLFDQKALIWISADGTLKGINCNWLQCQEMKEGDNWTTALHICTKTDALIFKGNPERNTFDIVLHGNVIENLTSSHCRTVLLQYINKSHSSDKKQPGSRYKEKFHENPHA